MITETNIQMPKRLALLGLLIGALALCGCGAKKTVRDTGTSENSSRAPVETPAGCNQFSSSGGIAGKVMSYASPTGEFREDILKLRLTGVPSTFDSNSKYHLKFYRWKALPDGDVVQDTSNPIEFRFDAKGYAPLSGYMTDVSITEVNAIKNNNGITAANASEFFNKVDILLFEVDYDWDVLRVVLYDQASTSSSKVVSSVDVLMPGFNVNPNQYAEDHPAVLYNLHPFWATRTTTKNFTSLIQNYCF